MNIQFGGSVAGALNGTTLGAFNEATAFNIFQRYFTGSERNVGVGIEYTLSDGRNLTLTDVSAFSSSNTNGFVTTSKQIESIIGNYASGASSFNISFATYSTSRFTSTNQSNFIEDLLSGSDTITGTTFNDTFSAFDGSDFLNGGAGDDDLDGGTGNDTLNGGSGDDNIVGGQGVDTATYDELQTSGVMVDLATGRAISADSGTDNLTGVENILGSGLGDMLQGDSQSNVLDGAQGDDVLFGGGGDDFLVGGTEFDIAEYSDKFEAHSVSFVNGSLIVSSGGSGTDTLTGIEQLRFSDRTVGVTSAGGLVVVGSENSDTIGGTNGADDILGGGGGDRLTGGAGADTFRYLTIDDSTNSALDIITDFVTGTDRIDIAALNSYSASVIRFNGDSYIYAQTPNGFQFFTAAFGIVNGSDLVFTNNHGVYMIGSEQGETLIGSANNDPLQGNGGDDVLIGGLGGDAISGGAGADTFLYRSAAESVAADDRYDNLYDFESGIDRIDLGAIGTTSVSIIRSGGSSFVFSQTTSGVQLQLIAAGRDINGDDFVYGAGHGVFLTGSAGGDFLRGGAKADSLAGGDGNDTLIGGLGGDYLAGEGGADTYKYRSATESTVADSDRIGTFQTGIDKIDLSAVRMGPNDVFNIVYSGGGSFIFVDLGDNGSNDMLIQATSVINASDITWNLPASTLENLGKDQGLSMSPVIGEDTAEMGLRLLDDAFAAAETLHGSGIQSGFMLTLDDPLVSIGYHHDQGWWI